MSIPLILGIVENSQQTPQWVLLLVVDNTQQGLHQIQDTIGGKVEVVDKVRYAVVNAPKIYPGFPSSPKMRFCALLYYTNVKFCSFDFELFVAPQKDIFLKVCQISSLSST